MFEGIEFTQKIFFWLYLVIPVLIAWYGVKHHKTTADLKVSNVDSFGQNTVWTYLKHGLFGLRLLAIDLIITALAPQKQKQPVVLIL